MILKFGLLIVSFWLAVSVFAAETPVRFAHSFNHHMVVQRNQPIHIWGYGSPGQKVIAAFANQKNPTVVKKDGTWSVRFKPMAAGGPYELSVANQAGKGKVLGDILVGDVWLCAGQSNMEWTVAKTTSKKPWPAGVPSDVRFVSVERTSSAAKLHDFKKLHHWQVANTKNIEGFSAACALFAEQMKPQVKVPIGLVESSWGGSQIETWVPQEALAKTGWFAKELTLLKQYSVEPLTALQNYIAQWAAWWHTKSKTSPWQQEKGLSWAAVPILGSWTNFGDKALEHHRGLVWYAANFDLPKGYAGKSAELHLGGIDEIDVTWLNGQPIGTGFGWGTYRTYTVPAGYLAAHKNRLAVNVLNTWGEGGMLGPAQAIKLVFDDGFEVPLGARWQYSKVPSEYGYPDSVPWFSVSGYSTLYNAMTAPLTGVGFAGVLWYQGESNTGRPHQYQTLLKALIQSWRDAFGKDLPVVVVQLPNYGKDSSVATWAGWAGVRHAQWQAVKGDASSGLVVTLDLGDPNDIHPTDKTQLAKRAANVALALQGVQPGITQGVYPARVQSQGQNWAVIFEPDVSPLVMNDGDELAYVELCAERCKRVKAQLNNNQIKIAKPQMPNANKIRYCWVDAPNCRLYGKSGLPVSSFEIQVPEL